MLFRSVDGELQVRLDNLFQSISYATRLKAFGQVGKANSIARQIIKQLGIQTSFNNNLGHMYQGIAYAILEDRDSAVHQFQLFEQTSRFSWISLWDALFFRESFGVFDGIKEDIGVRAAYEKLKTRNLKRVQDIHAAVPGVIAAGDLQ